MVHIPSLVVAASQCESQEFLPSSNDEYNGVDIIYKKSAIINPCLVPMSPESTLIPPLHAPKQKEASPRYVESLTPPQLHFFHHATTHSIKLSLPLSTGQMLSTLNPAPSKSSFHPFSVLSHAANKLIIIRSNPVLLP